MSSLQKAMFGGAFLVLGFLFIGLALINGKSIDSFEGVMAGLLLMFGFPMFFKNLACYLDSKRDNEAS